MNERVSRMVNGLSLEGVGLEVAPLFNPALLKSEHNVYYTDYTTTDELRKKQEINPHWRPEDVLEIDFVWEPGKRLIDCVPSNLKFDYALASHVIEHVPNPIGWISQILEVLQPGGVLILAVPDKRQCFDFYRPEVSSAELIDSWIRDVSNPTPKQIFECLSHAVDEAKNEEGHKVGYPYFAEGVSFEQAPRLYDDTLALQYAFHAWQSQIYLDMHCYAYTPQQFVKIFKQIAKLGLLNAEISEPFNSQWMAEPIEGEFYVHLKKLEGDAIQAPKYISEFHATKFHELQADLDHARKAFQEAVAIQKQLYAQIERLKRRHILKRLIGKMRSFLRS